MNAAEMTQPASKTSNNASRFYVKLTPLTPEQTEKGIYVHLAEEFSVVGSFVGLETSTGQYGEKTSLILDKGGAELVLELKGNLKQQLTKNEVAPGDEIEVIYKGKFAIKNGPFKGTKSHTFEVVK